MNKNGMTEAAEKALRDTLGRAIEFDQIVNMPGWKRIESYYQNKVQRFTTEVILSEKPLSEFESERSEIKGIRGLLNSIQNDLEELKNERKAPRLTNE